MSTSAPAVRTVDQLPAVPLPSRPPSKLWAALDAANERNAEFERLKAERHDLIGQLAAAKARNEELEDGGLELRVRELAADLVAARTEIEVWRDRALSAGWSE